jgi:hypothetical protein
LNCCCLHEPLEVVCCLFERTSRFRDISLSENPTGMVTKRTKQSLEYSLSYSKHIPGTEILCILWKMLYCYHSSSFLNFISIHPNSFSNNSFASCVSPAKSHLNSPVTRRLCSRHSYLREVVWCRNSHQLLKVFLVILVALPFQVCLDSTYATSMEDTSTERACTES